MTVRGFTLVELLVAISVVSIVSAIGFLTYSSAQQTGRDSRRKQDLNTINVALQLYYQKNKKYPEAKNSGSTLCNYGMNCYVFSTSGDQWISGLINDNGIPDIPRLPLDPINNVSGPWNATYDYYSYAYGNVSTDGQTYDLTARLENGSDPDACGYKGWKFGLTGSVYWCPGYSNQFGGIYSNKVYEASPDR